ncbi:MAG: hydrolase [Pelagibacteraceae bacterium]|jgi:hypothetical protein|nr:hydrolase [Pelagibacteraceae bacterium]
MLIEKEISRLIIIDVQEKLVSVMPKPHTFIDNIIRLQKAANILGIKQTYSEQYPKGLGKTLDKIDENLYGKKIQTKFEYIEKTEFGIDGVMGGAKHCIICGIEAHVCVLQTAINLAEDKKVYVVQDAIASRNEKDYLLSLNRLDKHPNIQIVSCEMVLFEWLRTSDHPEFKTISQLIK